MGSPHKFLKAPFLILHFSNCTLMTFLMMLYVIFLSILMILLSTLYQASALWQQLELTSKLESDLRDTVDWGRKWLMDSMLEKINWFRLTGLITLEMDGSVLEEKSSLKMLGLTFSSKLDWGF